MVSFTTAPNRKIVQNRDYRNKARRIDETLPLIALLGSKHDCPRVGTEPHKESSGRASFASGIGALFGQPNSYTPRDSLREAKLCRKLAKLAALSAEQLARRHAGTATNTTSKFE
jgi:hypothetical protein